MIRRAVIVLAMLASTAQAYEPLHWTNYPGAHGIYVMTNGSGTNVTTEVGTNSGTIRGTGYAWGTRESAGGSLYVTGATTWVDVPGGAAFMSGATSLTIAASMRRQNDNSVIAISRYSSGLKRDSFVLYSDGVFYVDNCQGQARHLSTPAAGTNWFRIVYVVDFSLDNTNKAKIYINGTKTDPSYSGTLTNTFLYVGTESLLLGLYKGASTPPANGHITDVVVDSAPWTPEIVSNDYAYTLGTPPSEAVGVRSVFDVMEMWRTQGGRQ